MKRKYEKPAILKLQTGFMNKFGSSPLYTRNVRTEIDGVKVDDLVSQYGSPLFVFSEKKLRNRFRDLHNLFSTRYPNVTFGWSYKTNYWGYLVKILFLMGHTKRYPLWRRQQPKEL